MIDKPVSFKHIVRTGFHPLLNLERVDLFLSIARWEPVTYGELLDLGIMSQPQLVTNLRCLQRDRLIEGADSSISGPFRLSGSAKSMLKSAVGYVARQIHSVGPPGRPQDV